MRRKAKKSPFDKTFPAESSRRGRFLFDGYFVKQDEAVAVSVRVHGEFYGSLTLEKTDQQGIFACAYAFEVKSQTAVDCLFGKPALVVYGVVENGGAIAL